MEIKQYVNLDRLKNKSLDVVLEKVDELLEKDRSFCRCENCVLDLMAYTLNHVTPMYRTSLLDPLHPNWEKSKKVEIEIDLALKAGVERIRRNPHHDD